MKHGSLIVLTQEKSFATRLAQIVLFAVVARLALNVTTLAHSVLSVAKFTQRTFLYAACKLQEVWRTTARAPIWLPKASLASVMTTLARVLVVIETVSTIGDAPRGKIGTRALDAGIFAVTTVVVPETP